MNEEDIKIGLMLSYKEWVVRLFKQVGNSFYFEGYNLDTGKYANGYTNDKPWNKEEILNKINDNKWKIIDKNYIDKNYIDFEILELLYKNS